MLRCPKFKTDTSWLVFHGSKNMDEKLDKHILKNGMVLLGEPMDTVESAAFGFFIPAGAATLPDNCCGAASVIADWIFRGAGGKTSRELNDSLDGLGLHRSCSISSSHFTIGAALQGTNLTRALELYADIILRPNLQTSDFELAKQLAMEAVKSLDDDPRSKVMLKLKETFFPDPLGRNALGNIEKLKRLTPETTKKIIEDNFNLSQTIFAIAGKYDFQAVCTQIEQLFNLETPNPSKELKLRSKGDNYTHIDSDSAQVHVGLATETAKPTDENYYDARVAVSILSGGMSARLFTEVREKRGLCYAIGAQYHGLKQIAGILCYAGTISEKTQETTNIIITEFNRLKDGITKDELQRAKAGLKASLILQSESSSSRASAAGSDYYLLGKVRTLEEIKEQIEKVTVDSAVEFLKENPFEDFTVVTIGPKQVKVG